MSFELASRITMHEKLFQELVDLIPTQFYKFQHSEHEMANKFQKNKKELAPKQAIKDKSKKAKRNRLDPELNKLEVTEAKEELEVLEHESEEEMMPMVSSNAVELKEKLRNRIKELRDKRNPNPNPKTRIKKVAKKQRKMTADTKGMDIKPQKEVEAEQEPEMMFGKIDFGEKVVKKPQGDIKALLLKAEKKQEKINSLDEETKRTLTEAENWKKMTLLADGVKPKKDNIKLLKKAVKRKDLEKQKAGKEWKEREAQKEHDIQKKQKQRTENLNKRKSTKKVSKKKGF